MKIRHGLIITMLLFTLDLGCLLADNLPAQPGDPGMSTPLDGGILMMLLSVSGLGLIYLKKKKKR